MKITVKMIKGETFTVEAEPATRVSELKSKIEAVKEECGPRAHQKLIFQGRILVDDKTVGDYPINESNFLVVMIQKPKPAAAMPPAAAAAEAPADTSAADPAVPASEAAPATGEAEPAAPDPAAAPTEAQILTLSGVRMESVEQLCAMGFPRPEVIRCLRAAFGNADRAVEYLTGGIPDAEDPDLDDDADADANADADEGADEETGEEASLGDASPPAVTAPEGAPIASPGEAPVATPFPAMGGSGGGGGEAPVDLSQLGNLDLETIRDNPQFQQLRAMIQQNPGMLQDLMQNPEFMQLISQLNQDELMAILNDTGDDDEEGDEMDDFLAAMQAGGTGGANVELSEAENEAVERLQQLGFTREVAVQAYVACGKNEEVAASMLFEHGEDAMM